MHKLKTFRFIGLAIPFLALILTGCVIPFPSSTSTPSIPSTSLIISESTSSPSMSSLIPESSSSSSTAESSSLIPSSSSSSSSSISSSSMVTSDSSLLSSASTASTSSQDVSSQPVYQGYYQAVNGVSDVQLKPTLTTILRSILTSSALLPAATTYGNARYDLAKSDIDPNNPNNIILVYSQQSVSSTWDAGSTWNREHVFPQSLLGVSTDNSSRHKGADYHNLKPASPSMNSSRGNKYFAETTTSTSYSPPAVVRGDVARILFYMVTMWPELSLVDVTGSNEPATFQMAQLSVLVKWHVDDPVDAFETNRNEVIYSKQGNRNPYIDHQEFVCRVWGNTNTTTQQHCAA